MKNKSIIFIVIAIILAIVGFSSTNTSKQTDAISKAVYVEDGKVIPENEGKIVIVPGEVKAVTPLVDELTGVKLPGIRAKRNVERYQKVSETKDDKTYYVLEWKSTTLGKENEFGELVSSNLIADCKIGEFDIDKAVLNFASISKKYHDIDKNVAYQKGYNVVYYKDVTYLTKTDLMPDNGVDYNSSYTRNTFTKVYYRDFENMPRISYTVENEESGKYTLIGRQQNGKLMYDKDLGMQAATKGIMNPEQLAENVESGGMIGAIVAWALAAFFVLLAVLSMRKKNDYVPTKEELEEIEKDIE